MEIKMNEITVRELTNGYSNNDEEGVYGYGGKLNIRPKYQREFIYNDKERDAVIDTLIKKFPLNTMYWVDNKNGEYELLDGQQRSISICQYVNGDFSFNKKAFHNLTKGEQEDILDYKLNIYFCSGTDKEKLDWFHTINIATKPLTDQELRNTVYTGEWLTDAKRYFSKNGCPAHGLASKYLNGSAIRQDYLETALSWINKGDIEGYMSQHQQDPDASKLWLYFKNVIDWVDITFIKYRKEMKGIDWGPLYDKFSKKTIDSKELESRIEKLMSDDDITNKKGIYYYIFTEDEKKLNIRAFTDSEKRTVYEKQKGICSKCGEHFEIEEMEADHIKPWSEGGKTELDNCQILCKDCNRRKSNK